MSPMDMVSGRLVFCALTFAALAMFAASSIRHIRVLRSLQPLTRTDQISERIWGVISRVFGQWKLFYDPLPGLMHAVIFWGFCIISVESIHFFGGAFGVHARLPLTSGVFYALYEIFLALVGVMVFAAFTRRLKGTTRVEKSADALFVLSMILLLVVTGLILSGEETIIAGQPSKWRIVSNALMPSLFSSGANHALIYNINWWLHGLTFLFFLNYLPFSKHMHVLTILFNVYFRDLRPAGHIEKLDLENAERFGLADIRDLTWKDALDGHTCTECGRCTVVCPANRAGKTLDPRRVILNVRDYIRADQTREKGAEPKPLTDGYLTREDMFACTTCHACVTVCPVENEQLGKIIRARQNLVLMEGDMPEGYERTFRNLENNANPWGIASAQRGEWATELKLPMIADHPDAEYLYFMGCASCYDSRAKSIAASFSKLLTVAGVNFAVLGGEEFCCGDPARRMGNEYLFQELLEQGRTVIEQHNLTQKKFLTTDPHCYNILKNEYADFDLPIEIYHHTTFLQELISSGKLKMNTSSGQHVTFHDSCYIGRYNGITEAPRQVLTQLGCKTTEMPNNRLQSQCCGAGGGRAFMEEEKENRLNLLRVKEAVATGSEAIVMSCPYCVLMFEDGLKDIGSEIPVWDIAELMAAQLLEPETKVSESE